MSNKALRAAVLMMASLCAAAQAQTRLRAWPEELIRGRLTAIATGDRHGLALRDDGTVTAWAQSDAGPTPPAGLRDVTAIAAGPDSRSFAVKRDGTVVAWGGAVVPAGLTGIIAIADGIALKRDGTVVDWWYTPPAGLNSVIAIASGGHHLALKSDGTVVGWGSNLRGQATPPAGLSGVIAIAAGEFHSLALRRDGTVVGWGGVFNEGTPPPGLSGVVAIAAGHWSSFALKSDGTVAGWGLLLFGNPPRGLSGVKALAAGGYNALALKTDGSLAGWGWIVPPPPATLEGVVAIARGAHSLAVKQDGTVVGWGNNHWGMNGAEQATPPFGLRDVVSVAVGTSHSLALKRDGTVIAWGYSEAHQISGETLLFTNAISIAAGDGYSVAAHRDGTVSVRGAALQPPAGLSDVVAVSTGGVALKRDGTVVTWPGSAPPGLNNVVAIAGQLALRRDGTVVRWDSNGIQPTGLSDVLAISSDGLALKRDGTVVGWPVNPAVGVNGAIAIAGSASSGLAIVTLQGMVRSLVVQVESLGTVLHRGELNSLTQKLRHAEDSLNRGNSSAACGQLGAFDNEVQAMLRSGRLTPAQAEPLVTGVAAIRSGIPCR